MQAIASALVKAQKDFSPALKCATNPHFKSKYADLAACLEAVQDPLNNNGIALLQVTHEDLTGVTVETLFIHESGEQISGGKLHVPASKQDPQGYGSALTYARRYSLLAACGIAPEDDDGNAASKKNNATAPVQTKPAKVTQVDLDAFKNAEFESMELLKDVFGKIYSRAKANEQQTFMDKATEVYAKFKKQLEQTV